MIPLPPLQLSVSPSSSAQSGARADSYQGGVQQTAGPFGDFTIQGGGKASSPILQTSGTPTTQMLPQATQTQGGIPTPVLIGGVVLIGVAAWLLLKKPK